MYDGSSVHRGSKSADDVLLLAFGACGVRPEGREGWILRMGTARPPNDKVVRAMVPPRRSLLQQASEPMQVGGEDRDTHGAFEACPAMRAHPVQAMTFGCV